MKQQHPAIVPGVALCFGQFLDLPFGQEGINERFDQVFVFLVQFFHFLKLAEQFFIGKLRRNNIIPFPFIQK